MESEKHGRESYKAESLRKPEKKTNTNKKSPQKKAGRDIAYQNKDITSKIFAEQLKGKSFQVYGVDTGRIRSVLPTNIPAVKVNELRLDNLLELEDGTVALVDYESEYKRESKVKYLNYLSGIVNRYEKEGRICPNLRMIVVYTGDIRRETVSESYDVGAVKLTVEPAFLSELDGDDILSRLKKKVGSGEKLDDREQMEFIILPLSYRKRGEKERKIQETVELAVKIRDREQQLFVLAGILTFTDKIIDEESAKSIRRVIQMTKVAMIFEREKEEAVKQAVEAEQKRGRQAVEAEQQRRKQAVEAEQQRRKQAVEAEQQRGRQAIQEEKHKYALRMIADGSLPLEKIAEYLGLDVKEVAKLAGQ